MWNWQYILFKLNKPEIRGGIMVGIGIVVLALLMLVIGRSFFKGRQKLTVEQCVRIKLEQGKQFFDARCGGETCSVEELRDEDVQGFVEFVGFARWECEQEYGK